ncbi:GEVED domain-containing protein [Meridianimaribacter flavus]|uniref:Secreted protein (Por secretion system target) n=1 Tax=Meridianimaribacter flavus TaxID=571115 RepID=A0ABY2G7J0_9FLAO|nr:GEVED domain-containing protein [Meridianimaribacter flavus]TDY13760.1 putative secreted protein (Por secretion system target) [Meridianimaribacter flavus]
MRKNYFIDSFKLVCLIVFCFGVKAHAQYCTPSFADPSQHFISRVQLNSIDNSSTYTSTSNSYSSYTGISTDLTVGNTYTLTIHTARVDSWRAAGYGVWIDYNNDNDFNDPGEQIWSFGTSTASPQATTFTVPGSAVIGSLRMRINMVSWYEPGACAVDGGNFGETEDYTVNIIQSPDPSAANDSFSVLKNSSTGIDNQIDVSLNDDLGSEGGDADNYSITTSPTNGIVTEISDGVFEYVPNTDFIGTDSFTYTICDVSNDCDTATVNIGVNLGACEPTISSGGSHYITNVSLTGENATAFNNTTGDDGGYGNYTHLPAVELYTGNSYTISASFAGGNIGWAVYIDLNQDGDFTDPGENLDNTDGEGTGNLTMNIPTSVVTGTTIMRVGARRYWWSNNPCGNTEGHPEEFEDYKVDIKVDPFSPAEIEVTGNSNPIVDGSTTVSVNNHTDFTEYDIYEILPLERTFTITNNGALDLSLIGVPTVDFLTPSTDFSISTQPSQTVLGLGESTTFTISFNPTSIGVKQATVIIYNDDSDENPYTFLIEGEGVQTFPDTDGDGVPDNVDVDDDNDGLSDAYENDTCLLYPQSQTAEVIFLNEDFGSGTTRRQINANVTNASTTYCYEDGTGSCPATYNPTSVNDGDYTVHHTVTNNNGVLDDINTDISDWADDFWYEGPDHTTGDTNGRMAIFNATEEPGIFYSSVISGVTPNVTIEYGFWAINLDRTDAPDIETRERPEVLIEVFDPNGNLITSTTSGLIEPTDAANPTGDWIEVAASFVSPYSQFTVVLSNNNPGGIGNDLAIDDIFVKQVLCDLDGDGIVDSIDLDNDNDGIPNVVELQLADGDKDATVFNDPINVWVDANGNGLHDAYESLTPIDTDGDGVPDYLDADSDNDGIFDNLEYDHKGDIDIDGDGTGDGDDIPSGDISDEKDGDGILAIMDLNDDGSGNDHGSNAYPDPLDSDGDGIPDYLDIDSNDASNDPSNGSDIDTTIYASYDADNDGIIDGSQDDDKDGILDSFDTDNTVYGSPRDLDFKYTLFFDGRNDYVSDNVPVIGAWSNATLMAWVKVDPNASGVMRIFGQENIFLKVNPSGTISAVAGVTTLTSTTSYSDNIWIHVAATYEDGENFTLYINGKVESTTSVSGTLSVGTTDLTIGRKPGISGEENVLTSEYFMGEIEEVRLLNIALPQDHVQKMVYQELNHDYSFDRGTIIPLKISSDIGLGLVRYYKMDAYVDDILDDKLTPVRDSGTGAKMYNIKHIYFQTAPMPYETVAAGDWSATDTWLHGDVWDITDETNNKDWSIVHIKNDVTTSNRHGTLGLISDANTELEINNDQELYNTWYLKLDGFIDLEGESQLTQNETSNLFVGANGKLERDQQGTENKYTYNYWSSPVHSSVSSIPVDGTETYTIEDVMLDGTEASSPEAITFIGGYDGSNLSSPISIAEYWLWKFVNNAEGEYSEWEKIYSNTANKVGEGYTMKGPGNGPETNDHNYVFSGKPNNGTINLEITEDNDYLVGNPYPSAIDADEFLNDNPSTNGTLYFWEHWGGGSHILAQYQGGYGLYNFSGGTPAISDQDVSQTGSGTKTPRQYIPVSQGFFVNAISDGNIIFENDQRIFVKEGASNTNSWFFRNSQSLETNSVDFVSQDIRSKYRIGVITPNNYKRQLLLTEDENATLGVDWGYDGNLIETNLEDAFWVIDNNQFVIQGVDSINETSVFPISVKANNEGVVEFKIDGLENVEEEVNIYLKDFDAYHNLEESNYITTVTQGITTNRFEIVFSNVVLSTGEDLLGNDINIYYDLSLKSLVILNNKNKLVQTVKVINMLGQHVMTLDVNSNSNKLSVPISITSGAYIFEIATETAKTTKKSIINN